MSGRRDARSERRRRCDRSEVDEGNTKVRRFFGCDFWLRSSPNEGAMSHKGELFLKQRGIAIFDEEIGRVKEDRCSCARRCEGFRLATFGRVALQKGAISHRGELVGEHLGNRNLR